MSVRWRRASECGCRRPIEHAWERRATMSSSKTEIDRREFLAGAGAGAAMLASPAVAQEKFPAREISWIIYQAPGGSIDTTARIIQPYLEKSGVKTTLDY